MEENKETLNETEENKASSEKKEEKNPKQDVEAKLVKAEADCEHWKNESVRKDRNIPRCHCQHRRS